MLIPCIDLQDGQAVQLVHGKARELAVPDVLGLLEKFKTYPWLHVIDLDAAMNRGSNAALVQQLCSVARKAHATRIRVGGGIRTVARAVEISAWDCQQIIIGSAIFKNGQIDTTFLQSLTASVPQSKIILALDTDRGHITVNGWTHRLNSPPEEVMSALEPYCAGFLCTDVDREGTMFGANLDFFLKLRAATTHPIIAAGGITARDEVDQLEKLGIDAAAGMAMYKNRLA